MGQIRKPDAGILGEMRQFWAELLQFCQCQLRSYSAATLTSRCQSHRQYVPALFVWDPCSLSDYYYSTSIADRQKIFQSLVSENLTDVHLAASAYLCATRRFLLFQLEGSVENAVEWTQRAQRYHEAARDMMADDSYPLCSRIGAGIDLRLGYVSDMLYAQLMTQILQDNVDEAIAIHEMTRSITQQNLGFRPIWYLTHRLEQSTISFQTLITTDVLYCLVGTKRQTAFDVRLADLPPNHEPGLRNHLGIPATLLSAMARINNLAADPELLRSQGGKEIAWDIDATLVNWKPEIRSGMTASCLTETVAEQAMWCEVSSLGDQTSTQRLQARRPRYSCINFCTIAAYSPKQFATASRNSFGLLKRYPITLNPPATSSVCLSQLPEPVHGL
jgi:hypothetical protein